MTNEYFEFKHNAFGENETINNYESRIYDMAYRKHPDDWKAVYAECDEIMIPIRKEYEKAFWSAIKNGLKIKQSDIDYIRESELCGWDFEEVDLYTNLEKSYQDQIMVITDDEGNYWGITGYYSPYEGFKIEVEEFKRMKKILIPSYSYEI